MDTTREPAGRIEAIGASDASVARARGSNATGDPASSASSPPSGTVSSAPAAAPGAVLPEASPAALARPSGRERRTQGRESVDAVASILVVKSGSRFEGRVADLSMAGCGIRLTERFPLGIYTRTEVEFQLAGIPFRLGGVIQSIHDQYTVGIRFLDVSERKRLQVAELIEEIQAARTARSASTTPPLTAPEPTAPKPGENPSARLSAPSQERSDWGIESLP